MRCFTGGVALSPFRLRKIEARWHEAGGRGRLREARFLYFVETEPTPAQETRLLDVIGAGNPPLQPFQGSDLLLVVPRLGTVSPWSSKATDILERVGLFALGRIERGIGYLWSTDQDAVAERARLAAIVSDPLTESLLASPAQAERLFEKLPPRPLVQIPLTREGVQALVDADRTLGLGLEPGDPAHLVRLYRDLGRDPTDAELMMWAQIHSEHCRHHIFNSPLERDGVLLPETLFDLIRATHAEHPGPVRLAYRDNAAVLEGGASVRLVPENRPDDAEAGRGGRIYRPLRTREQAVIKVETHNHPTAIAPFPGAATGSGGEIRDESATGRGARPRAGLCGFSVSYLRIPGHERSWEAGGVPASTHQASPLAIMLEGPIGAASYNNEFGRPNLLGYFRSFEWMPSDPGAPSAYGFHKPVMLAGGIGAIAGRSWRKRRPRPGLAIVVLGGPSFLIGLGGGSQSSQGGASDPARDWASVQRGNAEMERRTQEVINQLAALGPGNPIVSIHDVGAGGLANAIPELVWAGRVGAVIDLGAIPRHDSALSPMELWCNESQERYVMALEPEGVSILAECARRERCPWAVIGQTTVEPTLIVRESESPPAVALPLNRLFATSRKSPRVLRVPVRSAPSDGIVLPSLASLLTGVLESPTVADKSFLVTIADRTVGGLSVRDPLVGTYQVPVADVAVVTRDFVGHAGYAMSLGERAPVALIDPAASARLAIAEAITNLVAADVGGPEDVAFSANWMAAAGDPGEEGALYAAVEAASHCARRLGIPIPVGKDSLSMRTRISGGGRPLEVRAPVTLVLSAFARVGDVRRTLTPAFAPEDHPLLMLVDLSRDPGRLGGSVTAEIQRTLGRAAPDLDDPSDLLNFWRTLNMLKVRDWILAYHDRSDGGAWVSALEMAWASRAGLEFEAQAWPLEPARLLLDEAPGAVFAIRPAHEREVCDLFRDAGFAGRIHRLARTHGEDRVRIAGKRGILFESSRSALHAIWSETTHLLQRLRDEPETADAEQASRTDPARYRLWSSPPPSPHKPARAKPRLPRVMVLREQGVNGQIEMAAAFHAAGGIAVDVHMSDLIEEKVHLADFDVLAACGGFSYGDVLGAGVGWAESILSHPRLRRHFEEFFRRPDTLSLGVCNGCQMMSRLGALVPGAEDWPHFERNRSERFEGRVAMVRVVSPHSPWFQGMRSGEWPIVVSHGEGRAVFAKGALTRLRAQGGVALEYLSGTGQPTELYPANPNGSPEGVTGFTNRDGRVLILMPHPERSFRSIQLSWHPADWGEHSPWFHLFENAVRFVRELPQRSG